MFYPPYAHMLAILITSKIDDKAGNAAIWMTEQLRRFKNKGQLVILGPAKAPVGKIKDKHRYQVILKSSQRSSMQQVADAVVEEAIKRRYVQRNEVIFDVDPYHFF
jgi:primosomal protein N' (replication factor Y)